jgi:hypothetical protein
MNRSKRKEWREREGGRWREEDGGGGESRVFAATPFLHLPLPPSVLLRAVGTSQDHERSLFSSKLTTEQPLLPCRRSRKMSDVMNVNNRGIVTVSVAMAAVAVGAYYLYSRGTQTRECSVL